MKYMIIVVTYVLLILFSNSISQSKWPQIETKIVPSDGAEGNFFGTSICIDSDYVIIGETNDNSQGPQTGAAYIYKRDGNKWKDEFKLIASDAASVDQFGTSVAIDGDYAIVGAYLKDEDVKINIGSAYIYLRNGNVWEETSKLMADDGAEGDLFGYSVSIYNDYAAVGAAGDSDSTGSVYIFKRNGTNWNQETKLTPSDGMAKDWFGYSVSLQKEYLVIGAPATLINRRGAAYVFKYEDNTWNQELKLTVNDEGVKDEFGCSVSLNDDLIVIGTCSDRINGIAAGSAYIFNRNDFNWYYDTKLFISDGIVGDYFGHSVSINNDYVVIGAPFIDDDGFQSGASYIFKRYEDRWTQTKKITSTDAAELDYFGWSVSLSADYMAVGAYTDDDNGFNSGSAYIYNFTAPAEFQYVKDVPNDQGGQVTVQWEASSLDTNITSLPFYSIWRALPEIKLSKRSSISMECLNRDFTGSAYRITSVNGRDYVWEWLANQPAHNLPLYSYTAQTLYDSTSMSNGKHYFLITAHTGDSNVFYDSKIDSGCSVDNLAPLSPGGLTASVTDNMVMLNWNESTESDLYFYNIYRNGTQYDSTTLNIYKDTEVVTGQTYSYRVTAMDIHENESDFSKEVIALITQMDVLATNLPTVYQLYQNHPNPFNPITKIQYDLPKDSKVSINVYNIRGQMVRELVNNFKPAGSYQVTFDSSDLASGVYFYRLKAGDFVQTKHMLLIK